MYYLVDRSVQQAGNKNFIYLCLSDSLHLVMFISRHYTVKCFYSVLIYFIVVSVAILSTLIKSITAPFLSILIAFSICLTIIL